MGEEPTWSARHATAIERRVREAWPQLAPPPPAFSTWLDALLADESAPGDPATPPLPELYLCWCCGQGDARAIAALESNYGEVIRSTVHRVASDRTGAEDLAQIVRRHLFTGERPAIASYRGRGALAAWLGVVAMRTALNAVRRKDVTVLPASADAVLQAAAMEDLEVDFLKAEYRSAFKHAFEAALSQLQPRQRTILRQHLVEGLTVRQLGTLYAVSSSTIARWVVAAREQVAETTRAHLRRTLDIGDEELDALMRSIRSRVDLSLSRVLAAEGAA